jgi:ribonuclease E
MSKEIYISSTPHETRLAIVEDEALTEIYYERENEYTLAGSIYNGRVTRVLPGMQSSFVDIGLERDAFLYITDFMEEAPDSEEFDTTSSSDRPPRTIQGERAEGGSARVEAGPHSSDRSERGGRGRRGGRDRDRSPDRGATERTPSDRPAFDHSNEHPNVRLNDRSNDRTEEPRAAESGSSHAEPADSSELGEGAPGADGNRRWRGRRGRRRGRGVPGQTSEPASAGVAPSYSPAAGYPEDDPAFDPDSYRPIEAAAAAPDSPAVPSERRPEQRGPEQRVQDQRGSDQRGSEQARRNEGPGPQRRERFDSPRRDQQRTDQQRADQQRTDQQRTDQQRTEPRAPRGFTPTRDLYGVDSSSTGPIANAYPDADADAAAEPIILPGESLSKYRKGEQPAAAEPAQSGPVHATPITLAPPKNLYTVAEGWDGGAVLPGETLSRRRPAESRPQREIDPRREARHEGRRENRSEFRNPPAQPEAAYLPPAEVARQAEDMPPAASAAEIAPVVVAVVEPLEPFSPIAAIEVAAAAIPETVPVFVTEPAGHVEAEHVESEVENEVETEYEPHEASASYRLDPVAPSEFRQAGSTLEPPAESESAGLAPPSLAHSITPAPGEHPVKLHSELDAVAAAGSESAEPAGESPEPPAAEAHVPAAEAHDITAVSASGEMISEPVELLPEAEHHPALIETPEPASPIRHEGAIVSESAASFTAPAPGSFLPGSGHLDEEILDDEESEGTTLHASSIEEIDDLEEETLEGAADLGTMLREMSIDNITRTSPEVDEEDDLEEDDLDEEDEDEEEEDDADDSDINDIPDGFQSQEGFQADRTPGGRSMELEDEHAARSGSAEDAAFFERQFSPAGDEHRSGDSGAQAGDTSRGDSNRDTGRESDRRGGRRDGRRGRNDRDRGGDRNRGGRSSHSNGHGRHSMQSTNLPAISDLLKPGQEILVQIAKEPIAKKGARITSHIALPGRFLVFMPTVNHTGVSRKIESDAERRRLKEILLSEKGDASGGFIVRTAAEGASEEELRSDLRFLLNLWADIKARSESSKSPALIYHDLNLIERILRDQVTDNFSAIWVDSEAEYERVLRFLQRFQPSLIRRVKLYLKDTPLFEQFGITEEINKALRSKVWLKSGGSIVINQTEALVAIDINTGKFVGKTARLEDTIVKTNLDAIPEIVRQIRLRDLGGIIIIDFIDMDERKNRNRVMAALEEELKSDRAPSKVLQFNDFGLVAITRKRVKQSLERTLSTTCTVCTGTGMVKSPVTVCNDIYIEMRKMHKHLDRGDVMLRVHPEVVKQLKASGAKWLQEMEEMAGKTILVKSDPSLHPEQFDIH